ncbi:MAG: [FeFe] hydrogenase, group A [Oscillospiraceae bacterium]|nr:[FeFe] hydrogenase, group A [Oscillospiraceae bacterium]
METVQIKINGIDYEVPQNSTILEAARYAGIHIPTLCYLKDINEIGACRICVVEVKGARSLVASCVYPVSAGMEIQTNTELVQSSRKTTLQLLLASHDRRCLSCARSGSCELQSLCNELGVSEENTFDGAKLKHGLDNSTLHMVRDNNKCILCRRCVGACENQYVSVIGSNDRGFDTHIGCAFEQSLEKVPCVSCGQCIVSCPTGALMDNDHCDDVMSAISNPDKYVIVHTAPAVRATLGECFGMPPGTNVKGKMVNALRKLGFDKVFDTDFGADLTIMEEAAELIHRITNGGTLPMITSCSPGWIKFCEYYFPNFLPNISSCKSPQQMMGAILKTWYASKMNIDPNRIVVVSVMPCTAKKFEIKRDHQCAAGVADTDYVLTTREVAKLIKRAGIDFVSLNDENFDSILGVSTGAAAIFGATGGVMEAALRTASDMLSETSQKEIEYKEVRGIENIKEATYEISGLTLNVAVVSGLKNSAALLERVKRKEVNYHFIEIMCCPGGCVNGGGQPLQPARVRNYENLSEIRAKTLYAEDKSLPLRKSHENPSIKLIYDEYFKTPGSEISHKILHTKYKIRDKF